MTTQQLADELGIGYGNARYLMQSPGFPSFRVGRQYLVHPDDFAHWRSRHIGCTVETPHFEKPDAKPKRKPKTYFPLDFSKIDYFA